MKVAMTLCVSALAASLSGCSPAVSVRPLYTDADLNKPVSEPRIEGEWISPNLDKAGTDEELFLKWKVAPPTQPGQSYSTYPVEFRPAKPDAQEGEVVTSYGVRLVTIADKLFFDADFDEQKHAQLKLGRDAILGMAPVHVIGRVWVQKDFLRVAFFDSDWVKDNSLETFRESVPDVNISVITGSTADLRNFVLQNADNQKALPHVFYLCRPGSDCAARAFEDELLHPPEDDHDRGEMFGQAAKFFLLRNNSSRAIEILRRQLEGDPHDAWAHMALCRALLFKRDFATARIEFAAAQKFALKESPSAAPGAPKDVWEGAAAEAAEGLVWSYFLEGDYAGAAAAAAKYKVPDSFASADPILLSYFSLQRMGKRKEAEALLNEQSKKFRGSEADHLLLLDAQGRVIRKEVALPEPVSLKGDALQRSDFYKALQQIEAGKTGIAMNLLHSALAVSDAAKDGLPALAARIELDRLGPAPKK